MDQGRVGCVPRVGRGPRVPILSRCRPPASADSERKQKLLSLLGGGGEAKQNRRGYFKPDLISPLSPPGPAPAALPHHPPPPSSAALLGELLTFPALFSVRGDPAARLGGGTGASRAQWVLCCGRLCLGTLPVTPSRSHECQPFLRRASRPSLRVWGSASPVGVSCGFPP